MKYCTRCGTQAEDQAKFCTNCGAQMNCAEPQTDPQKNLFEKLCSRLRVSRILLLISAILQLIGGIGSVGSGIGLLFAVPWIGSAVNDFGEYVGQYHTYIGEYTYDLDYYYIAQYGTGAAIAGCIVCIAAGLFVIAISIVNFTASKRTSLYLKQIQYAPVGIIPHFQSAGKSIALLVVNILGGGALGIIGAAFAIAARCVVTDHRAYFENLERQVR